MLLVSPALKGVVWAVFVASGMGLLLLYLLPGAAPTGRPLAPGENRQLTGQVKAFETNRNGDIDKLLLLNSTGAETRIAFPPHTARQVMQLAPKSSTITASVIAGPPHGPAGGLRLVQLRAGDAILDIADMAPPPPATGKPVELSGPIDRLIMEGPQQEVSGLEVAGYRIVLPPHLARSVAPLLQPGKPVVIKGYERSSEDGFVHPGGHPLVKPFLMTLDSTDYLL